MSNLLLVTYGCVRVTNLDVYLLFADSVSSSQLSLTTFWFRWRVIYVWLVQKGTMPTKRQNTFSVATSAQIMIRIRNATTAAISCVFTYPCLLCANWPKESGLFLLTAELGPLEVGRRVLWRQHPRATPLKVTELLEAHPFFGIHRDFKT